MPASSNFNQAIREAQTSSIVGPNVVQKALPYVGGGMALTSFGALGGLTLSQSSIYGPLFIVAISETPAKTPKEVSTIPPPT